MKQLFVVTLMVFLTQTGIAADLRMPRIFGDRMVLQRNQEVRFWGKAEPGEKVTVSLDGFTVQTRSDKNGSWECLYPEHLAGGPYTVNITTPAEVITFEDVWFGDVWVAGGQSNMEWKLKWKINDWEEVVAKSDYPQIRFFEVPNEFSVTPNEDLSGGSWAIASPETSPEFSAVAWFFALHNHQEKDVPVGIIDSNWGGTPAETWISAERLVEVPGYEEAAQEMLHPQKDWQAHVEANEAREKRKWELINDQETFLTIGAHTLDYDDTQWEPVLLPNEEPLLDFVWLRKNIDLTSTKDASLYLGDVNQLMTLFVNGERVAEESWQDTTGIVGLPAELLRKGENNITLRVINSWNNEVRVGRQGEMWLKTAKDNINLEGEWKFSNSLEPKMPEVEFFHWRPGTLFNAMIAPIAGYSIAGAIWYQGESNADKPQYYNELFESMIEDWRVHWRQGRFPFLYVQLANYMERREQPSESQWAELREAQTEALALPKTGMATIIDIGEANDIHPRNKQDVGKRLWLAAKKVHFGENLVFSGPMFKEMTVEGSQVFVSFDHVGSGLKTSGETLKGFEVAGNDGQFYWADAQLSGDQVILESEYVTEPAFIRYAWADNPEATIYNEEGLPAVPFRTDK